MEVALTFVLFGSFLLVFKVYREVQEARLENLELNEKLVSLRKMLDRIENKIDKLPNTIISIERKTKDNKMKGKPMVQ